MANTKVKKAAKKAAKRPAGPKPKPCNCVTDKFMKDKFINPVQQQPPPHVPPAPVKPRTKYWMDDAYAAYWELYWAVVRLEKMVVAGAVSAPDPAPYDQLNPALGGRGGAPPPPSFP